MSQEKKEKEKRKRKEKVGCVWKKQARVDRTKMLYIRKVFVWMFLDIYYGRFLDVFFKGLGVFVC